MYTDIEFICAGNNGRSPVAQAEGEEVVRKAGLSNQVNVSSSGTYVDLSQVPSLPELLKPYVQNAIKNKLIAQDRLARLNGDPEGVLEELIDIETGWRNKYILEEMGIDFSSHIRRQTIVRPEARLILPVDDTNLKKVGEIYTGRQGVKIALLPRFAEVDYDLDGSDLDSYESYADVASKTREVARKATIKALDL